MLTKKQRKRAMEVAAAGAEAAAYVGGGGFGATSHPVAEALRGAQRWLR